MFAHELICGVRSEAPVRGEEYLSPEVESGLSLSVKLHVVSEMLSGMEA